MVEEIQADRGQLYRLFKQFHKESIAIIIASVSLVVSAMCALLMVILLVMTVETRSDIKAQNERLAEMSQQIQTQDAKLYALKQSGAE